MYKRIISFVLVIATVFCFAVPTAFAATEYYSEPVTWGEYILTVYYKNAKDVWDEDSPFSWAGTPIKSITTTLMYNKICEQSYDGYHASLGESISHEAFGMDEYGRYCLLSCDYCGKWFRCYSSDLIAAHDEYVNGLDSTIISNYDYGHSVAMCLPASAISNLDSYVDDGYLVDYTYAPNSITYTYGTYAYKSGGTSPNYRWQPEYGQQLNFWYSDEFAVPVDSTYNVLFPTASLKTVDQLGSPAYYYLQQNVDGSWTDISQFTVPHTLVTEDSFRFETITTLSRNVELSAGYSYRIYLFRYVTNTTYGSFKNSTYLDGLTGYVNFEDAVISSISDIDTPESSSRPGSLMQTINNYNVDNSVVDNSSNVNYYIAPKSYVTNLTDNSIDIEQCTSPAMYDEETLVFTVPGTDYQILTTGWTYDYTTRTYDISVAPGTTTSDFEIDVTRIVITYGDDTVYFSLYLADGTLLGTEEYAYVMVSGDENFGTGGSSEEPDEPEDPGEDPEEDTHKHSYTSTVTTEPTCEAPGIRKYICDECGDSYTERISATGHTWMVKQTVATQYDDTGSVTVQGYTIYKCSVCNTEYKDDAGTGPPNNSADSGDDEGIFKKIGQLLGSILSGLLGMIEAVLGSLLDGLVRLADLVGDKLTQVVEIVTGLFDKIPQLFGGFTALLADVFVFIPEDIITIFTFGAAAIVFVGILMFFIKR